MLLLDSASEFKAFDQSGRATQGLLPGRGLHYHLVTANSQHRPFNPGFKHLDTATAEVNSLGGTVGQRDSVKSVLCLHFLY